MSDMQTVKVGKGGQFVLPSSIRERLSLQEGTELVLRLEDEEGGRIVLVRRYRQDRDDATGQGLVEEGGMLLLAGTLSEEPAEAVRRVRNERLDKLAGL